jgi:hypothetical protein
MEWSIKGIWGRAVDAAVMLRVERPTTKLAPEASAGVGPSSYEVVRVTGLIMDKKTKQPIAHAVVTATGTQAWCLTKMSGWFEIMIPINKLKNGLYIYTINYQSVQVDSSYIYNNNYYIKFYINHLNPNSAAV